MRPAKGDPQIDHDRLIRTAWELVDEVGLTGLSSRKLASKLGVSGPALYHHVSSMTELYGMMIDRLLQEARERTGDQGDWRLWIRELARNHCDILLSHRDSGRIASLSQPSMVMLEEVLPGFSKPLIDAGISHSDALAATGALGSFILGYIINLQHEGHRALVSSVHDAKDTFEFAIDAFVSGLEQRLAKPGG